MALYATVGDRAVYVPWVAHRLAEVRAGDPGGAPYIVVAGDCEVYLAGDTAMGFEVNG